MTKELEKETQQAIIQYLLIKRVLLLRINSVQARLGRRRVSSYIRCGEDNDKQTKGVSDLIGCTQYGKFIAIEVKREGERATPEQRHFLEQVRAGGGIAILAFTLDDVVRGLEGIV